MFTLENFCRILYLPHLLKLHPNESFKAHEAEGLKKIKFSSENTEQRIFSPPKLARKIVFFSFQYVNAFIVTCSVGSFHCAPAFFCL